MNVAKIFLGSCGSIDTFISTRVMDETNQMIASMRLHDEEFSRFHSQIC